MIKNQDKIPVLAGCPVSALGQYKGRETPIKINALQHSTNVLNRWDFSYLASKCGNSPVMLVSSDSRRFDYRHMDTNGINMQETGFADALQKIASGDTENKCLYIQQCAIRKRVPELLKDLDEFSGALAGRERLLSNLWVGQSGALSPLHFDRSDNFLYQVSGEKYLTLFAPNDSRYLYPNPEKQFDHVSQVDIDSVDTQRFPEFEKARAFRVHLAANQLIYIPKHWWHQVETTVTSISVNYWFRNTSPVERVHMALMKPVSLFKKRFWRDGR